MNSGKDFTDNATIGWFGPITEKAVKLFQKFYELVKNGIAGEKVRG